MIWFFIVCRYEFIQCVDSHPFKPDFHSQNRCFLLQISETIQSEQTKTIAPKCGSVLFLDI